MGWWFFSRSVMSDCLQPHGLLSMGFPREEYWNGLPFTSPGDLPDPGMEPRSLALQVDSFHLRQQGREEAKSSPNPLGKRMVGFTLGWSMWCSGEENLPGQVQVCKSLECGLVGY